MLESLTPLNQFRVLPSVRDLASFIATPSRLLYMSPFSRLARRARYRVSPEHEPYPSTICHRLPVLARAISASLVEVDTKRTL